MKILMLTPYLPYPPASGGQIRTLNLLKYLSKNNQITLISLYKNLEEKRYAVHLEAFCKRIFLCKRAEKPWQLNIILKSILSLSPLLVVRNFSPEASEIIQTLLKTDSFDVIHAETFYIMPHIPKTEIPIFLLEQTIEYEVYQHFVDSLPLFVKYLFIIDILKLKFWERFYWKKALLVGTVSESDKRLISRLEPDIKPVVVPNGAGDEIIIEKLAAKDLENPVALFLGNFYWLQNTEAADFLIKNIYPKLKRTIPAIKLIIAGQNAENKLHRWKDKDLEIINIASGDTQVVKRLYQKSTIFISPIFGPGGTRLKILAAMATGLPVISTKVGITGLLVRDNQHILIADTPDEFVKKIKSVLSDKNLYEKLRRNSYELVKEVYNWKKIAHKLELIYQKIKKHEDRD